MSVFIDGILLKNYRGIGASTQKISKFERCNFFIGTNNSGKSCVLNFISAHLKNIGQLDSNRLELTPLEIHLGAHLSQVAYGFPSKNSSIEERMVDLISKNNVNVSDSIFNSVKKLLNGLSEKGLIWTEIDASLNQQIKLADLQSIEAARMLLSDNEWQNLWHALTRQTGGICKVLGFLKLCKP